MFGFKMSIDFISSVCEKIASVTVTFFALSTSDSIAAIYSKCNNIAVWTKPESLCFILLPVIFILIHLPLLILCATVADMNIIASINAKFIPFFKTNK